MKTQCFMNHDFGLLSTRSLLLALILLTLVDHRDFGLLSSRSLLFATLFNDFS